jgi:Bacterial regulatory proteins, tetR family.
MATRSEQSRQAILRATMRLLDEREPDAVTVQQLSIERIAREAGVGKTTIYRWWPSKAAVVIDAFLEHGILATPLRDDLPAVDALREHVAVLADTYRGHEGRLMAQLIAECQYDPAALDEFKRAYWRPRREVVNALIRRAVVEGALRGDRHPDEIAERLYAPIYVRLLLEPSSLDADAARNAFDVALEGLAAR